MISDQNLRANLIYKTDTGEDTPNNSLFYANTLCLLEQFNNGRGKSEPSASECWQSNKKEIAKHFGSEVFFSHTVADD